MDTSSTAVSVILHTLTEHPKEQEILRKEIITARQGGVDLSYDELIGLPYLDAICRETLRLFVLSIYHKYFQLKLTHSSHAIIPTVIRKCMLVSLLFWKRAL